MAYVKRKRIKGNDYYYLAESYRAGGKVKTRTLAYLGRTPGVPEHLAHHTTGMRRRGQKILWDPQALGRAVAKHVRSRIEEDIDVTGG